MVNHTTVSNVGKYQQNSRSTTWDFTANDDGQAFEMGSFTDRSVQAFGNGSSNFSGGTLTVEGSNDGQHWSTLKDALGTNLTFTTDGLKQVLESTKYIRPKLAGAGATPNVRVILFCTKII